MSSAKWPEIDYEIEDQPNQYLACTAAFGERLEHDPDPKATANYIGVVTGLKEISDVEGLLDSLRGHYGMVEKHKEEHDTIYRLEDDSKEFAERVFEYADQKYGSVREFQDRFDEKDRKLMLEIY